MKRAGLIILATLAALTLCAPLGAAEQTSGSQWAFSIPPYLLLLNVDSTPKYGSTACEIVG